MITLPFSGVSKEALDMVLDGRRVTLRVRYGHLTQAWTLDVLDRSVEPSEPLVLGIPIRVDVNLLAPYALDMGAIVAVAIERPGEDPLLGELGVRVQVAHIPRSELT